MRRLALLLGVLVGILGISTLLAAPDGNCDTIHPGRGKDDPRWCRFCPAPEPDCQLVACDRCGCDYWCPGDSLP
jgi:hypothetical protein